MVGFGGFGCAYLGEWLGVLWLDFVGWGFYGLWWVGGLGLVVCLMLLCLIGVLFGVFLVVFGFARLVLGVGLFFLGVGGWVLSVVFPLGFVGFFYRCFF